MRSKLLSILMLISYSLFSQTIYVDQNATGSDNGTDWINAYTNLQTAITNIGTNTAINVAQGTYYATTTTDRTISFNIPSGVKLYGGFPTGGGTINADLYPTILSGDIGVIEDNTDNSYHVVSFLNTISSTEIDGFIIEKGYADGGGTNESNAGGIFISTVDYGDSNAYIRNCIIRNNYAAGSGGGILVSKRAEIYNCKIHSNQADNSGGGIYINTNGRIYNSYIVNNKSVNFGGGIYITGFNSAPKAINCVIANNECEYYGAGAYLSDGRLNNCTIVNNEGNGIHFGSYGSTYNGIIWGNTTYQSTHVASSTSHVVKNNCIQDITSADTNVGISSANNGVVYGENYPKFTNPTTFAGNATTPSELDEILNANWYINPQSAAIDLGDNSSYPTTTSTPTVEIIGNNRTINTTMDSGAYEAITNIVTNYATNQQPTSADLNGEVLFAETGNSITRGFVYDITPNFDVTTATSLTNSGTGLGVYSDNVIGLTENQLYYFRTWVEFDGATYYGNEVQFEASNLAAHYPFNGNANDESGNGNHGTPNGVTLTSDRFGNPDSAYSFDGNDIITIPHDESLNSSGELSFSVWVNPNSLQNSMILGKSNYTSTTNYLLRTTSSGYFTFEYKGFAYSNSLPLTASSWNHVAVVSQADNSKLVYINGTLATHTTASSPYGLVTNELTIGARPGAEFFNGSIDDLRIYKSALTETQILSLYNNNNLNVIDDELNKKSDFYVFENSLYLNDSNLSEINSITIYNLLAQNVYETKSIKQKTPLSFLDHGIYIINVQYSNGQLIKKKVLIH